MVTPLASGAWSTPVGIAWLVRVDTSSQKKKALNNQIIYLIIKRFFLALPDNYLSS
jgi:hypothetical protein